MKNIKILFSFLLMLAVTISCSIPEGIDDDTSFLNSTSDPAAVTALATITQDNTGKVTLTPRGEGVAKFEVYFGDATTQPATVTPGNSVVHIYKEGIYKVKVVAFGITGKKTENVQDINVSFRSPENLVVTIENDKAVSKKVTIKATADFALFYDVYFGEDPNQVPVKVNNGESTSHIYATAGTYKIKIVSKSGAIKPTVYEQDFVVTAIMAPTASAPMPSTRAAGNVIGIYGSKYTNVSNSNFFPDWGQAGQGSSWAEFDLNGDKMLQYSNLSYQGIDIGSEVNATSMQFLHVDIWTATSMSIDIYPLPNGVVPANEKFVTKSLVANQWNSFDIPLSDFTSQGLPISNLKQFKFVGTPWAAGTVFIDNIYFYKNPAPASGLEGTWRVASEPGSLGVGPAPGDKSWWAIDAAGVTARSCFFDDTYVFGANGSFSNVLGNSTWLEGWQGTADACGTPVAPHNGSGNATYIYDSVARTITITGAGAYLGLPKATNAGELGANSAVPNSRVYSVTLSNGNNTMELIIETGSGVFWHFKLVKD
jgi:hypothetical protein